jgi:type IV pili sensor histidine kinase/response regulator
MTTDRLHDLRPLITAVLLAVACTATSPGSNAADVQVGRYSTLSPVPSAAQVDLLATTVTVVFPQRIATVGEAVHYLLRRSGYGLADSTATSPVSARLLALPLPAVHRDLGPIRLSRALETLAGPAFRLVHDPVHRLIGFELCPAAARGTPPATSSTKENATDGA